MEKEIIISLKDNTDLEYALNFLRHIDFIEKVDSSKIDEKIIENNYTYIASIKSLAEDWSSDDDNRWDEVLKD